MIYAENIFICIAVPFVITLLFSKSSVRVFNTAFLLGMFVCLIAAYISGYITVIGGSTTENVQIYISPVIEEMMKFLPLVLYLILIEPDDRNLFTAGLGIGAGFATFENCCYILSFGAESLTYILVRGLSVGVMHIVSVLAIALGMILTRRFKAMTGSALIGAVSLSMVFHGLYNLLVSEPGVSQPIGFALPIVTGGLLYVLYRRMTTQTLHHYDQDTYKS